MTHKQELFDLQNKARQAGRTCNFFIDHNGKITSVYYINKLHSVLGFVESERKAKFWHQIGIYENQ